MFKAFWGFVCSFFKQLLRPAFQIFTRMVDERLSEREGLHKVA